MKPRMLTPAMRASSFVAVLAILTGTGCQILADDDDVVGTVVDVVPPAPPAGVVSITGDGEVRIEWNENTESDLIEYRVYWSATAGGVYELVGTTRVATFLDRDVDNGVTYFYAVSAVDTFGNESELSVETVHDTPRPEGSNLVLWNYLGLQWELAGFDFSAESRRPFDAIATDVYFGYDGQRYSMIASDDLTDLQDAGYAELEDLDWAPPRGWSNEDLVTLIEGHSYYVWTRDDHFAKFRVVSLSGDRVVVDWAYQLDKANPELVPTRGGE